MKTLCIIMLIAFIPNLLLAQKYIGKDWMKVQYELGAKKAINSKLYVELAEKDTVNHVYHTINLVENDDSKNREWVLIQTYFNNDGICYLEIYTDFGSKNKAIQ